MTITASPENPKARKKPGGAQEALAALRATMQAKLAEINREEAKATLIVEHEEKATTPPTFEKPEINAIATANIEISEILRKHRENTAVIDAPEKKKTPAPKLEISELLVRKKETIPDQAPPEKTEDKEEITIKFEIVMPPAIHEEKIEPSVISEKLNENTVITPEIEVPYQAMAETTTKAEITTQPVIQEEKTHSPVQLEKLEELIVPTTKHEVIETKEIIVSPLPAPENIVSLIFPPKNENLDTPAIKQEKKEAKSYSQPLQAKKAQIKPVAKKATPHPNEWPSILLRISEHSHKLLREFTERSNVSSSFANNLDTSHISKAFLELSEHLMGTPDSFIEAQLTFWQDYVKLCQSTLARISGFNTSPVITPSPNDKRFLHEGWRDVWLFDFIKQVYLLTARWAQSLVQNVEGLDPKIVRKIDFYTRQMVDAISPSNFWMTNPEVLKTTIESCGENLMKGFENLLGDLERGQGQLAISMSDNSVFSFGENIATTAGKVVFQNELMQLIQYSPLTEQVNKTPMLIVPPWINKFYILDLREKNSFIRYLVEQGHTVFCISWVNPDSSFAKTNFDDYMSTGLLAALKEIGRITGEKQANVVGYCIGGTLLACALAYLKALGDKKPADLPEIASATYLVTLTDFSEPGDLGVFMDEDQVCAIEDIMDKMGYLDAKVMGTTFNLLRSNDLVWSFVVNNYLLGREPFPFDLLTWNSDSTNLPAAMQSFYLRKMYLENKLIQPGGVSMKDVPIDLSHITTPTFMLSARDDHIAPWRSTYTATQMYKGPVTFVLSGSGHIAGVINPPSANKYCYWTNPECPAHPDEWQENAVAHDGSWWPEWITWLKQYSGDVVTARKPGADGNVIENAPGSYVKVRVI